MGGGEDRAARASVETGSSLATCFQGWIISLFIKRPECTDVFTEEAMAALVPQEVEAEYRQPSSLGDGRLEDRLFVICD